ncbi:DNA methyltransferase [uncultured Flavobacterium sp.]|uniref:DNA methyltransferase n=1 Tax=uncultured Flavobacterium sp. TaxID=165435 RepID=UPI00308192C0
MNTNFKDNLISLLKTDERLLDNEGELMINKIHDLADKIDEKLIELLLDNEHTRLNFFIKIKEVFVFKSSEFKFYLDENKIDNSYTQYENRIGLATGGKFLKDSNDVVLDFPYKDCVLEGGQSTEEGIDAHFEWDEKNKHYVEKTATRKEIFFNEVLAKDEIDRLLEPKTFTKIKKYTEKGEEKITSFERDKNGFIKDNLIIKGNNLLALHSLKKEFGGRVKLIYIDPPYNTEKDSFKYNDKFTHSTWLTFMKNRLEIARELLSSDGSIYVQADWNEVHYLKILMDSIFGRNNFKNEIVWFYENKFKFQFTKYFNNDTEAILFYSKSNGNQDFKHIKVDVKSKRMQNQVTWDKELKKMVTVKDENGKVVYYESNDKIVGTLWNIPRINSQSKERLDLLGQKPENLLQRIIEASTNEGDIVLDYHLGTGTTCAVATKMNRQFIGIEQLDYIETLTLDRLKACIDGSDQSGISKLLNWKGGGSFVYLELAKNNQNAIDHIQNAKNLNELISYFDNMCEKYFLHYNLKIKQFKEVIAKEENFINLSLERQKEIFIKMLDLNQLYINLSDVEDKRYDLSDNDIQITKDFYRI